MTEKRTEVKVFRVELNCPRCNGKMLATGEQLLSNPIKYPHVCNSCSYRKNIRDKVYPHYEYIEIESCNLLEIEEQIKRPPTKYIPSPCDDLSEA